MQGVWTFKESPRSQNHFAVGMGHYLNPPGISMCSGDSSHVSHHFSREALPTFPSISRELVEAFSIIPSTV